MRLRPREVTARPWRCRGPEEPDWATPLPLGMGRSAPAGVPGLRSPAGGPPRRAARPSPEPPVVGTAVLRGRSVPVLVGTALTEDSRGSGLDPLPGRCSCTAPGGLRRPERAPPSPAPPRPRHRQKLRGSGARLPARSVLPPMAAGGTALKGTARWAGDLRGALAPAWGRAGRAVRGSLRPQVQAWSPARPRAGEYLAHPARPHLPDTCWRAAGILAGLGGSASPSRAADSSRNSRLRPA